MVQIRRRVFRIGPDFVCLYHYTQPSAVPLIAHGGLRVSTAPSLGGTDGGVYFSTLGPCSYGLGSAEHGRAQSLHHYQETLIKDCFGIEQLADYRGTNKLSAVLVYAIPAACLSVAPGGRDNSMVVSKASFVDLSLPDPRKNFFLSPAFVVGAFYVDVHHPMKFGPTAAVVAKDEVAADRRSHLKVDAQPHRREKQIATLTVYS